MILKLRKLEKNVTNVLALLTTLLWLILQFPCSNVKAVLLFMLCTLASENHLLTTSNIFLLILFQNFVDTFIITTNAKAVFNVT